MKVFDPTRKEYNARTRNGECPFCDQEVLKKQNCTKFFFKYWLVLVNKYPYMDGNVMLVTKKHHEVFETLSKDEWEEFYTALIEIKSTLSVMFETESFNIGLNLGEDSGRSLPHLHWQIIPRKRKNHSVVSVLADIQVITLSPEELKSDLSI
jgi:ATP adenylyltransferase